MTTQSQPSSKARTTDMARLLDRLVHVRRRGAVVRRRAAFARGSLHDDHQGHRQLRDLHPCCRDNPVLTRELLVTLRSPRSFVLQLLYVCVFGALVYLPVAGWRGGGPAGQPRRGTRALRHFLPWPVLPGCLDGADLRRGEHHRREGAQDLRAAAGQPAAARRRSWSASCSQLAFVPGDPDRLEPPA